MAEIIEKDIMLQARIDGQLQEIPIKVSAKNVSVAGKTLEEKIQEIIDSLEDTISQEDLENALAGVQKEILVATDDKLGGILSVAATAQPENAIDYYICVEETGKAKVSIPKTVVTTEDIIAALVEEELILNGGNSAED